MATKEDFSSDSDHEYEDAVEEIHTNSSDTSSNRCKGTNSEGGKCHLTKESDISEHPCDTRGESEATQNLRDNVTHSVKSDVVTELPSGQSMPDIPDNRDVRSDGTEECFFDSAANIPAGLLEEVTQDTEHKGANYDHEKSSTSEEMRGNITLPAAQENPNIIAESQQDKAFMNEVGEEDNVSGVVVEERDDTVKDDVEIEEVKRNDDINPTPFKQLSERLNERETEVWEGLEEEEAAEEEDEAKEEEIFVDEEYKKEMEKDLSEEEKEARRMEAADLKAQGNEHFKKGDFTTAMQTYTQALVLCPLCYEQDQAIMYSNRAACRVKLEENEMAVEDCSKALELHPDYVRALLRRAQTYEALEKLDEALTDYQRVVELDRTCHVARAACMRLPDEIKERNEKMKEEMMDKLKDLGNMVLRPFGLSTANFRMEQNPDSGSYNIQFVQNPNNNDE